MIIRQPSIDGLVNEAGEQMVDVYSVPCDVHLVRTFSDGRQLGVGYDLREPVNYFVYDRLVSTERWHKHCGPFAIFENCRGWILSLRA